MESIIHQLTKQEAWEAYLSYRLRQGRYNWREFDAADAFVAQERYLPVTNHFVEGGALGIPIKKVVNKMGSGKKRVVYTFGPDEMRALSLISYLLYRYDHCFAPNCFAFRRGLRPQDALRSVNRVFFP